MNDYEKCNEQKGKALKKGRKGTEEKGHDGAESSQYREMWNA